MGTSTSSRGPGSQTPLVPPWADVDGKGPGPKPEPRRFQIFRTNLGKFVTDGDASHLRKALGHYARTSTGGRAVGPRRFGSMARAGGALFNALSSARDGSTIRGFDLASLNGKDTDVAIDAIVQALVPQDGDADRIRTAMNEALSECLEGFQEFDFAHINDEMLVRMMLAYVSRCIFGQVVLDSDRAFGRATQVARVEQAERDLRTLVQAATDKHLQPLLTDNVAAITVRQIETIQLKAIADIWSEWEAYEP